MRPKQSNDRKPTRQDSQKKLEINGIDLAVSPNQSLKNKKLEPAKRHRQDLSLFEALVECATREESSGTVSDDDAGSHPTRINKLQKKYFLNRKSRLNTISHGRKGKK
jgi:hypothetical protein